MSPQTSHAYTRLLAQQPELVCVERCASVACRLGAGRANPSSLEWPEEAEISDDFLNERAAQLASSQGIRTRRMLSLLELPEQGEIEIVDWHCTQGFHTLAAMEALIETGDIDRLRRITLIDPREEALKRAHCAVALMAQHCSVNTLCLPFPCSSGALIPPLTFKHPVVIHLLPDCLTLKDADLPWLAHLIALPGHDHHIVSIQPFDPTASYDNLSLFSNFLPVAEAPVVVSNPRLGHTINHQPISLHGAIWRCSPAEKTTLTESDYADNSSAASPLTDALIPHALLREELSESLAELIGDLKRHLRPADKLLLSPSLPPYSADICVVSPDFGIALMKVVNSHPSSDRFIADVEAAVEELRGMRRQLALNLPGIDGRRLVQQTIRITVVASAAYTEQLPEIVLRSNATLIAPDMLHSADGKQLFRAVIPFVGNYNFPATTAQIALNLLFPPWHWRAKGTPLTLDNGQQRVVDDREVSEVIGASGSGKTTALLHRALGHVQRGESPVLIVVPDPSALAEMRRSLRTLYADLNPSDFHIIPHSDLFRKPVTRVALPPRQYDEALSMAAESETDYGTPALMHGRYQNILVDNAQQLTPGELDLLRSRHLLPAGRLCKFCNPLLDRYSRPAAQDKNTILLTGNYSFAAKNLRGILTRIISKLAPNLPLTAADNDPEAFTSLRLTTSAPEKIAVTLHDILHTGYIPLSDTIIVSEEEELLRATAYALTLQYGYHCDCTLASPEEIQKQQRTTRNPAGAVALIEDGLRHRFGISEDGPKLTTPKHLIGIHARHIILLYRKKGNPDYRALYAAVAGVTQKLTLCTLPS